MSQCILRDVVDRVCTLTLNRPEKLNALDTQSFRELDEHLGFIERQEQEITTNSWHTIRAVKRLCIETEGMSLADALAYEQRHYPGPALDHLERLAAFSAAKRERH